MATGTLAFTVTAGTPSAVTTTGTFPNGTYTIELGTDNTGATVNCVTPYGAVGQTGFQLGDLSE